MKTFNVAGPDGTTVEANQLATFTRYLNNIQFRFVVTELPGELPAVTHRISGRRVCRITPTELGACRHDIKRAANLALDRLIMQFSEERLRTKLAEAEGSMTNTNFILNKAGAGFSEDCYGTNSFFKYVRTSNHQNARWMVLSCNRSGFFRDGYAVTDDFGDLVLVYPFEVPF